MKWKKCQNCQFAKVSSHENLSLYATHTHISHTTQTQPPHNTTHIHTYTHSTQHYINTNSTHYTHILHPTLHRSGQVRYSTHYTHTPPNNVVLYIHYRLGMMGGWQERIYRRAGNFREVIFSLYSRIVRIRETLTVKISTDAH